MEHRLSYLKAAKIEWLLQMKKRLQALTGDFEIVFYQIYPGAHKKGGNEGVLAMLAVIEDIEAQLGSVRASIRALLTPAEQEILHSECRSRRSDAYERAIGKAISRLKAEIKAETLAARPARPVASRPAKSKASIRRTNGSVATVRQAA
jgi:hypothetical protein